MAMLLGLLATVAFVAAFVCQIMVLIKLFQTEGVLYGILGLICGLYALIWGWMNAEKMNIKNLMLIWTGLLVAGIVLQVLAGVMS